MYKFVSFRFLRVETAGGLPECAEIIDDWLNNDTPSRNAAGKMLSNFQTLPLGAFLISSLRSFYNELF